MQAQGDEQRDFPGSGFTKRNVWGKKTHSQAFKQALCRATGVRPPPDHWCLAEGPTGGGFGILDAKGRAAEVTARTQQCKTR